MARKGQFKKGGGRVGETSTTRARSTTTAIVVAQPRTVTHRRKHTKRKHSRKHGRPKAGQKLNLLHVALAAGALGYVTSPKGPEFIRTNVAKIPGTKTFGAAATIGLVGLGVSHFMKPKGTLGKVAKYAGIVGVGLAAYQAGTAQGNAGFKWLGDSSSDDVGDYDLADAEDLADADELGDEDLSDADDLADADDLSDADED